MDWTCRITPSPPPPWASLPVRADETPPRALGTKNPRGGGAEGHVGWSGKAPTLRAGGKPCDSLEAYLRSRDSQNTGRQSSQYRSANRRGYEEAGRRWHQVSQGL